MAERMMTIRVNASEANKDKGYETLLSSGYSILCLEDETYIVPEQAVKALKQRGVRFERLPDETHAPQDTD